MEQIPVKQLPKFMGRVEAATSRPKLTKTLKAWLAHVAGSLGVGFQQSKSPSGETWKPLARKRPKGHNHGSRPLIDFGDMQASVISTGPGHIEEVSDDSAKMGTDDRKAVFHQYGTSKIPARPFVGITDEMVDLAAEMVADDVLRQIGGG